MQKILMLRGLPASGKTTYAKELLKQGGWKRVNKDDLRAMVDGGEWGEQNEKFILDIRDTFVLRSLLLGFNVVVDDTNFSAKHKQRMEELVKTWLVGKEVKIEEKFFDVDVEECVKCDAKRANSVGAVVIRDMWKKYISKPVQPPKYSPELPMAVVSDIDGTLAEGTGRGFFEWKRVGEDALKRKIATLVEVYKQNGFVIILVSGRDGCCRGETQEWLRDNHVEYDYLFMREEGDNRKDAIVKKEIYDGEIKGKYNVEFVLDDRDQVVAMWRGEGLTCLQVNYGNF